MHFVENLVLAMLRLFLGESAEEKAFRSGMRKAQVLYETGLKYNGEKEYREAQSILGSIANQGSEGSKDAYQKLKLQILLGLKLCQCVVLWYRNKYERLMEIEKNTLGNDTPEYLENRLIEIAEEIKASNTEYDSLMTLPPSRKTEDRIIKLKHLSTDLSTEQNNIHDKLVSYKTTENKLQEYKQHTIENLGKSIDSTMQYLSIAREIKDLPEVDNYRIQNNLHRYFEEIKEYQTIIAELQADG